MSSTPRPAPSVCSPRAPRLASLSTSTCRFRRRANWSAALTPTHPGRITEERTRPVVRSIGPGRPMPAPITWSSERPASSRTSAIRPAAASSACSAAVSTSRSARRSASTVEERSATATRRWRWPKSTPSAAPAVAVSRSSVGGRPRPGRSGRGSTSLSTTMRRSCSSLISVVIVVRERLVMRIRSPRLTLPSRRSASTTRRRFARRSDSREPPLDAPAGISLTPRLLADTSIAYRALRNA